MRKTGHFHPYEAAQKNFNQAVEPQVPKGVYPNVQGKYDKDTGTWKAAPTPAPDEAQMTPADRKKYNHRKIAEEKARLFKMHYTKVSKQKGGVVTLDQTDSADRALRDSLGESAHDEVAKDVASDVEELVMDA